MDKDEILASVSKKMDIVIGLLLKLQPKAVTEKENILSLKEAGLNVDEIARALGKSSNSIYITLSRTRRRSP